MRIGEAAALRWSDVDLSANTLYVRDNRHNALTTDAKRTTKGRRSRRIPIHPQFRLILDRMARRNDGRVFGGPRGGILKPDSVRNILIRDVLNPLKANFLTLPSETGFIDGRLHSFRHYFVSQAFLTGASEGEIRDWVGHKDSRLIERYRHLRHEEAQEKMRQLSFLGSSMPPLDAT
jgi:integrase